MKYQVEKTIIFKHKLTYDLALPYETVYKSCSIKLFNLSDDKSQLKATYCGPVEVTKLRIIERNDPVKNKPLTPTIEVPESSMYKTIFNTFIDIYSFILDIPLHITGQFDCESLIPENQADEKWLNDAATRLVKKDTRGVPSIRTFVLNEMESADLKRMFERSIGFKLYSLALKISDPILKYREYWKILESAFGQKGRKLINSLSKYEPAKQLEFTKKELKEHHTLRGRASHADSRTGLKELTYVIRETSKKHTRLKCLIEQVLITKAEWGSANLTYERITPITGFTKENGSMVMYTVKKNK
ncbi:MAG: hypothetical protein R6U43_06810 [Candidatus Krumholzibacteriales bacterium]